MDKIYPNSYYIRVEEKNITRDGSDVDEFEPDFYYKDLVLLGDNQKINTKELLLEEIEKVLFGSRGSQLKKDYFKREDAEYGYLYTAKLEYKEAFIIGKSDDNNFNVKTKLNVELFYYPEISKNEIMKTLS